MHQASAELCCPTMIIDCSGTHNRLGARSHPWRNKTRWYLLHLLFEVYTSLISDIQQFPGTAHPYHLQYPDNLAPGLLSKRRQATHTHPPIPFPTFSAEKGYFCFTFPMAKQTSHQSSDARCLQALSLPNKLLLPKIQVSVHWTTALLTNFKTKKGNTLTHAFCLRQASFVESEFKRVAQARMNMNSYEIRFSWIHYIHPCWHSSYNPLIKSI